MAKIIKTDGQIVPVEPKNGKDFKLEELQRIVGGYIQLFYLANESGEVMVMNEEGKIEGLPLNEKATELAEPSFSLATMSLVTCWYVRLTKSNSTMARNRLQSVRFPYYVRTAQRLRSV
jgi:hypothetical protein